MLTVGDKFPAFTLQGISSNNDFVEFFDQPKNCKSNFWLQTLILKKDYAHYKEKILEELNGNGYPSRPAWSLMHKLNYFKGCPRMKLECTNDLFERIFNIPSGPGLV